MAIRDFQAKLWIGRSSASEKLFLTTIDHFLTTSIWYDILCFLKYLYTNPAAPPNLIPAYF